MILCDGQLDCPGKVPTISIKKCETPAGDTAYEVIHAGRAFFCDSCPEYGDGWRPYVMIPSGPRDAGG